MKTRLFLLLAVIAAADIVFAQSDAVGRLQELAFRRIDSRAGLSHNSVFGLLQDRTGYIWIATEDGLNRFDGTNFVVYRNVSGDSTSLWDNGVTALGHDRDGAVWIGTRRGLNRLNPKSDAFERYDAGKPVYVISLAADSSGGMWVNGDGTAIFHANAGQKQMTPAKLPELGVSQLARLHVDSLGTVRVPVLDFRESDSSRVSVFRLSPGSGKWDRPEMGIRVPGHLTGAFVTQIGGRVDDPVLSVPGILDGIAGLPVGLDAIVMSIVEDDRGVLWLGTDSGLIRLNRKTGELQRQSVDSDPDAFLSNNVTSLLRDRSGAIWAGTLSGLYVYDPQQKGFDHIGSGTGLPDRRGARTVMSVHEDQDGLLWVGSLGEGLIRIDRDGGELTAFRSKPNDPTSLPDDLVWAIHEDAVGNLWVGTQTGLCRFDRKRGRCRRFDISASVFAGDANGMFALAGLNGVFRVSQAGEKFEQIGEAPGHEGVAINALTFDQAGNLCTGARSLKCFDNPRSLEARPVVHLPDSAVGALIWVIHQDSDGVYWLGTRRGLLSYQPATGTLHRYYDDNLIPGGIVYSILEDDQARLWLGTNNGLVSFDRKTRQFRLFDVDDGVGNVEFNRRSASVGPTGRFYFGGLDGLTSFDPARISANPNRPPIVITQIEFSDYEGARTVPVIIDAPLVIPPSIFAFSIEYAALAYTSPAKNQYRYRLEGFEDLWIEAGQRRRAEYTNLDPGTYAFHVTGSNEDGVWNDEGIRLQIAVQPAWWETWWFRVALVLLVGTGLFLGYRYRVAQLLRMERMRLRIARDLHDDVGSRLSGLALMSDVVGSGDNLTDRQHGQLQRISRGTRELVDSLRDIVWFVHPDNEQPGELLTRMRETADELLQGINWSLATTGSAPFAGLDLGTRRHVFLVFKEALNNVARHSRASKVNVRIEREAGLLTIYVRDDGCGFDPSTVQGGYGLRNMQRRAEMLGGVLELSSPSTGGTQLKLEMRIT